MNARIRNVGEGFAAVDFLDTLFGGLLFSSSELLVAAVRNQLLQIY